MLHSGARGIGPTHFFSILKHRTTPLGIHYGPKMWYGAYCGGSRRLHACITNTRQESCSLLSTFTTSADLDPEDDAFGEGPALLESDEEADARDTRPSTR